MRQSESEPEDSGKTGFREQVKAMKGWWGLVLSSSSATSSAEEGGGNFRRFLFTTTFIKFYLNVSLV